MVRFFYKVLLSSVPLLLLYITDFVYSMIAMSSNEVHIESWYDLMHGKIESDVVAMGSSRTFNFIDPIILDSIMAMDTYNLGMSGSGINEQVHRYNLYRKYNKKPTLIIQNIDFGTLKYKTGVYKEQYLPYFWNISLRREFLDFEPFSMLEKYLPLYRYRGQDIWYKRQPRSLTKGYHEHDNDTWDGSLFNTIDSISFVRDEICSRIFDEYLARNKSEGIQVVFVYAPIYIDYAKKMTNLAEMYAVYQEYADIYDIPILDYTHMDICYDTTFFANVSHVNKQGAIAFSDTLAKDLLRLGIEGCVEF